MGLKQRLGNGLPLHHGPGGLILLPLTEGPSAGAGLGQQVLDVGPSHCPIQAVSRLQPKAPERGPQGLLKEAAFLTKKNFIWNEPINK